MRAQVLSTKPTDAAVNALVTDLGITFSHARQVANVPCNRLC